MSTPGAGGLVLAVLLPFVGLLLGLVLGGRALVHTALATLVAGTVVVLAIAARMVATGGEMVYALGGWPPPLGISLRADGLSLVMLLAVAAVVCGIGIYARADFAMPRGQGEKRGPFSFWLLLLAVWGSLNLVFVSGDLFTLYVALELLTFSAVPLVCLDGSGETLRAALRYLLYALFGSMLYLLGAVLLYGGYGTLDIQLLAQLLRPEPIAWTAAALMTVALLAKTALFPLHLWLPPAHAGAPAAASALLSALVIKGSWFLAVRLWADVLPNVVTLPAAQALGALGAAAILVGNIVALRQARLKLLIAYSTVAQIGYLFLMFPLVTALSMAREDTTQAISGGMLQAVSHALAKASMFMAAGLIYKALGHDRIADLRGAAAALPMTLCAFALAGASLIGLPPSGGFFAKWLLVSAALASAQWWWALTMAVGGLLTAAYVFIVSATGDGAGRGGLGAVSRGAALSTTGRAGAGARRLPAGPGGAGAGGSGAPGPAGGDRRMNILHSGTDAWLVAAVVLPAMLLAASLWPAIRRRLPAWLPLAPLPALTAALAWAAAGGHSDGWVLGNARFALHFAIDAPGALLLGVGAFLWSMAALYASYWLRGRSDAGRFVISWLLTLLGCIGVFVAADLIGFYFLLAVLSVGACALVLTGGGAAAQRAAAIYLGLALLAEAVLLMALVLMALATPDGSLSMRDVAAALATSPQRELTLTLLIVGLGMKAGLVPLHFWMPLAHGAAPVPASAILSGVLVKASVLGLLRLLPADVALPDFGLPLAAAGLFSALYAAAIGLTQQQPKIVLAYSTVSQMGFIIAIIGMGLAAGDALAPLATAFYAAHHVLVKGALFLAVGAIAATGRQHLWPMLLPVGFIALGFGGLPLTGGALAKYSAKDLMGDGLASSMALLSSVASTLLVLHFLRCVSRKTADDAQARAPLGLALPWMMTALAALLVPWLVYAALPGDLLPKALAPAALWDGLWPVLIGVLLAVVLEFTAHRLPALPAGDVVVALDRLRPAAWQLGAAAERLDAFTRRWAVACIGLLGLAGLFAWSLFAGAGP